MMANFSVLTFVLMVGLIMSAVNGEPSFTIDHEANTFLMDGRPFQYVSGSFHYFRALPGAWKNRLRTMRAAGLNVVDTYVEWALHNPHEGNYTWDGIADLEKFIQTADEEGLYVILRPGPYICAERDNGGLPHWLFTKYPDIRLRTSDERYLKEVSIWYDHLMPRLQKYMYGNGGPIIMVQVENEYGVFHACDNEYLIWLRDETESHVKGKALLFTTDIPNERMKCGKIEGVFATTDFGIDRIHEIDNIWSMLREIQPTGPLVNSEFYPGWLTHWQEENQRRDGKLVAEALRIMLTYKASVNFYMFFGGTNFGFTAGANDWGYGKYTADITSYDYDAPMDEAGGVTEKFNLIRDVIVANMNTGRLPSVPKLSPRIDYGQIKLVPVMKLLSPEGRKALSTGNPVKSDRPKSFEELDQYSGLVLYETELPAFEIDPTHLFVDDLRDRAFVYVDEQFIGTLSRENNILSIPLSGGLGTKLQLLVENQGRINFNVANDTKGIFGSVTIQKLNGDRQPLTNWISTSFPLEEINVSIFNQGGGLSEQLDNSKILQHGPVVYYGTFLITKKGDTFLNTAGWGKGVAYMNGFNLGRYWPLAGPQLTMYVPKETLNLGVNTLVLLEYERANKSKTGLTALASFDAVPQLDN